jgi:hypothetical protein
MFMVVFGVRLMVKYQLFVMASAAVAAEISLPGPVFSTWVVPLQESVSTLKLPSPDPFDTVEDVRTAESKVE